MIRDDRMEVDCTTIVHFILSVSALCDLCVGEAIGYSMLSLVKGRMELRSELNF